MAGTKIVTRKLVGWMGRLEEFSNVYYFGDGGAGLSPDEDTAEALINAVIAEEKKICTSSINFLGGAAYKIGVADTPGDTDAIATVELVPSTNTGSYNSAGASVYLETAVDIKWLLGGRRYLRNLIHTGAAHGYAVDGGGGPLALSSVSSALKEFGQEMLDGDWPDNFKRIAPNGDRPEAVQHAGWLNHRQFHRYRRRDLAGSL